MSAKLPRFTGPFATYLIPEDRTLTYLIPEDRTFTPFTKIGIDSLLGPITSKPWSHKGAWARIILAELTRSGIKAKILTKDDPWHNFDTIILDHGMEFNGVFNLFGGATDDVARRIQQFILFTGTLISYEVPMPDIGLFVKSREKGCSDLFRELLSPENIAHATARSEKAKFADAVTPTRKLVIGDSHSLSVWRQGYEIRRYDGKTLHGALKLGLKSMLYGGPWDEVVCYFGNIDIRHHLCRQPDPMAAVVTLVNDLATQVAELLETGVVKKIRMVELLPIEDESRKLPKTGYYKGEPFSGTLAQRQALVDKFNGELREIFQDFGTAHWTYLPRMPDGSLSFDAMEGSRSVHISPEWYPFNIETGLPLIWTPTPPIGAVKVEGSIEIKIKPEKPRKKVNGTITPNLVYQDLLEYHKKATLLENRARGDADPLPDDPLMCNVHIYDSVHRHCAGFSNLLEDYHFPRRVGKKRFDRVDPLPLRETLYLYLVHRVTGSAASFRPRPPGATLENLMLVGAHGYCNTILPKLWKELTVEGMVNQIHAHKGPYLTSKGNIPPQFKTIFGGYDKPSREYLCVHAPTLVDKVIDWCSNRLGIREVVDMMNAYNRNLGMHAFSFCYTAFVNDVAEYWPDMVDPMSHTNYGPNCLKTLALAYDGSMRPTEKAFDTVMEWLVRDTGFSPLDLEDSPACDIQRYWSEEVPAGYEALSREQTTNNSLLKRTWGESAYYAWVEANVHRRSSGLVPIVKEG
jgi:hypothetical protein